MNCLKKLLVTLIMALIICGCYSTVVFAEDIEAGSADTASQTTQDGELLGDGYSVDEDGNIYVAVAPEDAAAADDAVVDSEDATVTDSEDAEVADTEDAQVDKDTADVEDDSKKEADTEKSNYSKADLRYLSCLIYAEAGNQSYSAMLGVANVVLNRVDSDVFWHVKTIKDVIYDRKWSVQFAVTIKNSKGVSPLDRALKAYDTGKFNSGNPDAEQKAMDKAIKAAKAALNGKNNIGSYLCFSNKSYKSYVKRHYTKYEIIDDTIFFRAD